MLLIQVLYEIEQCIWKECTVQWRMAYDRLRWRTKRTLSPNNRQIGINWRHLTRSPLEASLSGLTCTRRDRPWCSGRDLSKERELGEEAPIGSIWKRYKRHSTAILINTWSRLPWGQRPARKHLQTRLSLQSVISSSSLSKLRFIPMRVSSSARWLSISDKAASRLNFPIAQEKEEEERWSFQFGSSKKKDGKGLLSGW